MSSSPPTTLLLLATFHGLLLLHGASLAAAAATPLDALCGSLGGFYVTPELCAATLCADPACRAADTPGLALIAARLAAASAAAARSNVEAALSRGAPEKASRDCLQLLAGAVPPLRWAAGAVADGRYAAGREVAEMARRVSPGCSGMAGDRLSKETSGFDNTIIVAHAVLATVSP